MPRPILLKTTLCALAALVLSGGAHAQATAPVFQQIATISVPGGLAGFDISWVDPGSELFFLADRTTTKGTGRIDVIDAQTNTFLYSIPTRPTEFGFAGTVPSPRPGCSVSGPNGVVAIPQKNQLYVGDGDSTVKVVDLAAKAIVAIIPTGGQCRADELAYDPIDHIIVIANPADNPPFLTFINVDTQTVVGKYNYPAKQNGLEQTVYSPLTKKFYLSRPVSTATAGDGGVDVIDPITMQVVSTYPTPSCSPAGLVLTANQNLVTSCGVVLDSRTGNILATPSGASSDQIWYNPGDNLVYFGSNGAVIDAESNQVVGSLSNQGHTLAVDPNNNHVFAPVSGVGIRVFAAK